MFFSAASSRGPTDKHRHSLPAPAMCPATLRTRAAERPSARTWRRTGSVERGRRLTETGRDANASAISTLPGANHAETGAVAHQQTSSPAHKGRRKTRLPLRSSQPAHQRAPKLALDPWAPGTARQTPPKRSTNGLIVIFSHHFATTKGPATLPPPTQRNGRVPWS